MIKENMRSKKYKVITLDNEHSREPQKMYNATDLKDAEEIYHHWITEAEKDNVVILIGSDGKHEVRIQAYVKK
jgi:hypothetical protein